MAAETEVVAALAATTPFLSPLRPEGAALIPRAVPAGRGSPKRGSPLSATAAMVAVLARPPGTNRIPTDSHCWSRLDAVAAQSVAKVRPDRSPAKRLPAELTRRGVPNKE